MKHNTLNNLFKNFRHILCLAAAFIFVVGISINAYSAIDTAEKKVIQLVKGELENLKVYSLTRLSLTNPAVADIVNAGPDEVLMIAKSEGETALFIWDDKGKRTVMIRVSNKELEYTKDRMTRLLEAVEIDDLNIEVSETEGKVVVSGSVPEDKSDHFDKIVSRFGDATLDLSKKEKRDDLIQIDVQITELNQTLSKSLGIDWNTSLTYDETLPLFDDGTLSDLFKVGDLSRSTALAAKVNALVTEGKGKVLSKPSLVVMSGEEASFLVGGQVPIRTTTTSDGATTQNVEFRDFGISMNITPTLKKGKIDLLLDVETSEVDASSAGTSETEVGFSTRSASTHLYLDDGQTIVIAGLIKQSESETVSKVPFLGDVPVLGLLFRARSNPVADQDQELVISLTPHVLNKLLEKEKEIIEDYMAKKQDQEEDINAAEMKVASSEDFKEQADILQKPVPQASLQPLKQNQNRLRKMAPPLYPGIPLEMASYVEMIQKKISSGVIYPHEAKKYGWEGTVKLDMLILNDGTLAYATIKETSGHDIFDEYALNTAKNSAPYEGFPSDSDLQELSVTIPIVYSLR